eukprot:jgi/Tetstr1/432733/TSEL_022099.t1
MDQHVGCGELAAQHHSLICSIRATDSKTEKWRKTVSTASGKIKAAPTPAPAEGRPPGTTPAPTPADDEDELELNYEEDGITMDVDTAHRGATEVPSMADVTLDSPQRTLAQRTFREGTPEGPTEELVELQPLTTETTELLGMSSPASKCKTAAPGKHKKKQSRSRIRAGGTARNRSGSKLRLSGTRESDNEWETDDETAHPSGSSHK